MLLMLIDAAAMPPCHDMLRDDMMLTGYHTRHGALPLPRGAAAFDAAAMPLLCC